MLGSTYGQESRSVPVENDLLYDSDSLVFSSHFDSGNLGRVERLGEQEYMLHVRPDVSNPRSKLWFYFSIHSPTNGLTVLLNITNFSKSRSLYRVGMSPVVRSTQHPFWHRIPPDEVWYHRDSRVDKKYTVSFLFTFPSTSDTYYFAYNYPYSYTRHQQYLIELRKTMLPFVSHSLLCRSHFGRKIDLLTIDENPSQRGPRDVFVISARIHPGESPSSFMMQGLIEFLIGDHPSAVNLRQSAIIHLVPMLNPDGVALGNYRTDALGQDYNRTWDHPHEFEAPQIIALKKMLIRIHNNADRRLRLYIDLHAHSTSLNLFTYGNSVSSLAQAVSLKDRILAEAELVAQFQGVQLPAPRPDMERMRVLAALAFPRLMDKSCDDFSAGSCKYCSDSKKNGTGRRVMGLALINHDTHCYTLEASFFGRSIEGKRHQLQSYRPHDYVQHGFDLGMAIHDFLQTIC